MSSEVKRVPKFVRVVRTAVDAITGRGNGDVKRVGTYASPEGFQYACACGCEAASKVYAGLYEQLTHNDWDGTGQPGAGEDAPHSRRTAPPQL